ncbi:hypothetical protein BDV93DRAFT_556409 [Ceratobasidium sp. AG-I]|nr:hypothetical protein BDV93DRAFT_556409 [Ceratobasidium sp. AG-I]
MSHDSHLSNSKHTSHTVDFTLLDAAQHIRLLDLFTLPEERTRVTLFAAAASACPLAPINPPRVQGPIKVAQPMSHIPPREIRTTRPRSSSDLSPSSARAEKRRATAPEEHGIRNEQSGLSEMNVVTNQFPETPSPMLLMGMQPGTTTPTAYSTPHHGAPFGHVPPLIDHSNLLNMANPINLGQGWSYNGMAMAMSPAYYNQLMAQMPALMHLAPSPGPTGFTPPTPTPGPYSAEDVSPLAHRSRPAPEAIQFPPSTNSHRTESESTSSVMTSIDHGSTSAGNTVFTHTTSHTPTHSYTGSAELIEPSVLEGNAYDAGAPKPLGTGIVMFPPPAQLDLILSKERRWERWEDWERDMVINDLAGARVSDESFDRAMSTALNPWSEDNPSLEWRNLRDQTFRGCRSATTLATQWASILETYYSIVALAGPVDANHASLESWVVATRTQAVNNIDHLSYTEKVAGKLKPREVMLWCDAPHGGWFTLLHRRIRGRPRSEFVMTVRTPHPQGGSFSKFRSGISTQSSSSASRLVPSAPTPSAPPSGSHSLGGSALEPSQPSNSSWARVNPVANVQPNTAGMSEMVRDQHAVSNSVIHLSDSKEDYLRSWALLTRVMCLERLAALKQDDRDRRNRRVHEALSNDNISPELRATAEMALAELFLAGPEVTDFQSQLDVLEASMRKSGPSSE